MKTLLKTVSVTLAISVTMLFFSCQRVKAVAETLITSALYVLAGIVTGIAVNLGVEVSDQLTDFIKNGEKNGTFTINADGTITYNKPADPPIPSITPEMWSLRSQIIEEAVISFNASEAHASISGAVGGAVKISADEYNSVISAATTAILSSSGSGSVAGVTLGITTVNGKPQKVTTTYAEQTIEVFDYLQLDYTTLNSIFDLDLHIDLDKKTESNMTSTGSYLPYIIKDGSLYVFSRGNQCGYISYSLSRTLGTGIDINSFFVSYLGTRFLSVRFAKIGDQLCVAFFGCSRNDNYNPIRVNRIQKIYGYPTAPSSYPVLFNTPAYYNVGTINTSFDNYDLSVPITFVNPANTNDILAEADILNSSYDACGYFSSPNSTPFSFGGSVGTAAKMMSGTENAVQGGTNTTYTDLSDIEKAIYALAKQQGISYDEMLEQCNIMINENGEMYLETLDGVTQSIDNLLSEFEKLLEQGSISNDNTAASVEELKAILEYLKGLNIEGIGSYIQQIEATLDGLKQGDEDREAVLGDISGQLTDLKEYLDSLGLAEVASDIKNISQILSDSAALEVEAAEIENIDPDWYIEKFPFCLPFDFYRIITLFVRDPVPPVFTVPIEAEFTAFGLDQSVDEEIVLDLTVFKINGVDIVQVVLNFVCILGFVLMLIHNTTKFFV